MNMGLCNVSADDVDIDVAASADDLVQGRTEKLVLPAGMGGLADDDPGNVPPACIGKNFFAHALTGERNGLGAQAFRKPHVVAQLFYVAFRGPDP